MAVISTPNASAVKAKFDHGTDLNGDRIVKTKTFSNVKSAASNDNVMAVINAIADLQQHTLTAVVRVDNSSLSE